MAWFIENSVVSIVCWQGRESENVSECEEPADLVLILGGCGLRDTDIVPEVVEPLLHREASGLAMALTLADDSGLARAVAGIRNQTLLVTLPCWPAAHKSWRAINVALPQLFSCLREKKQK